MGGKSISGGKGKREMLATDHHQNRGIGMASENSMFDKVSKAEADDLTKGEEAASKDNSRNYALEIVIITEDIEEGIAKLPCHNAQGAGEKVHEFMKMGGGAYCRHDCSVIQLGVEGLVSTE